MKIAYFGGDMFYPCMELLIQSGHKIIALFTGERNADEFVFSQHVRRHAETLGIPIISAKPTNNDINKLQQEGCDMILAAGYSHKIPPWQGGSIRYGVNIHPSLLPQGAGPMPMPLVILKGLKKTGVTLHELSPRWDAGNIILQGSFPLNGRENAEYILCQSQNLAVRLLRQFLDSPDKYWTNSSPQPPQYGDYYWQKPTPEELVVDFSKDVETVDRLLRIQRLVKHNGDIEFISSVTTWKQKHNLTPGTVISRNGEMCTVAVANGVVLFRTSLKQFSPINLYDSEKIPENV